MSDANNVDPEDQFQIGDKVIYVPEGVYCKIEGYDWTFSLFELPRIIAYRLDCGIRASKNSLVRAGYRIMAN